MQPAVERGAIRAVIRAVLDEHAVGVEPSIKLPAVAALEQVAFTDSWHIKDRNVNSGGIGLTPPPSS